MKTLLNTVGPLSWYAAHPTPQFTDTYHIWPHFTNILSSKHPVKEYTLGSHVEWVCFAICLQKLWFKWAELLPGIPIGVALVTAFPVNEFHLCLHDWLWLESGEAARQIKPLLTFASTVWLPSHSWPAALGQSLAAEMLCCGGSHVFSYNRWDPTAFIQLFPDWPQLPVNSSPLQKHLCK